MSPTPLCNRNCKKKLLWVQCSPAKSSSQMFIFTLFCWVKMLSTSVSTPPRALLWVPIIFLKLSVPPQQMGKRKWSSAFCRISPFYFFVFCLHHSSLSPVLIVRWINLYQSFEPSISLEKISLIWWFFHCLLEMIGISVSWGYSGEVRRWMFDKGKDWEGDIDQDFPHS